MSHHLEIIEKKKSKASKKPIEWETFEEYRSDITPTPTPARRSKRRRQRRFGVDWKRIEIKAYFDVREPGSYGGVDSLYRTMKCKGRPVTYKQVANWLAEQDVYTLHKPVRRRFPRRKLICETSIICGRPISSISLIFPNKTTATATFSHRHIFEIRLVHSPEKKDAKSVSDAFDEIFAGGRKPVKLQTDKGKEFVNAPLQKKLKHEGVPFYVSQNEDIKASVVERFNRTLKTKMWKYFTHRDT